MQEPFLYSESVPLNWTLGDVATLAHSLASDDVLNPLLASGGDGNLSVILPRDVVDALAKYAPKPPVSENDGPASMTVSDLIATLRHAWKLNELNSLLEKGQQQNLRVQVPPETVNSIKQFLFKGRYHTKSTAARDVVASASCIKPPSTMPSGPPVFPPPGPGEPGPL